VTVTAPPNTRIVGLDLQCNFPCPVTISADGQTATGRVEADNVHFVRPFYVQLQADANAPLAGGRFSGTFEFAGVTQPLDVDITAGTQGSVAIFPSNAPAGGGVTVNFVMQGSEAANSGLQAGDVITAINGTPVTNLTTYNAALTGLRNGATVPIIVRRNGRFVNINLTLD
jgi:membrane-associated protease RseP (regulator of RpoE activity)